MIYSPIRVHSVGVLAEVGKRLRFGVAPISVAGGVGCRVLGAGWWVFFLFYCVRMVFTMICEGCWVLGGGFSSCFTVCVWFLQCFCEGLR